MRDEVLAACAGTTKGCPLPHNLIEIDLRSQWFLDHVFVAPGIAKARSLERGPKAHGTALYERTEDLIAGGHGFYLTTDSTELKPHLDHIAVLPICELSDGPVHGHQALGRLRSPGASRAEKPGAKPAWLVDQVPRKNDHWYATVPTPASFHNAYTKEQGTFFNGLCFKGMAFPDPECIHFAADLPGAELTRVNTIEAFIKANKLRELPPAEFMKRYIRLLKRWDLDWMARKGYAEELRQQHGQSLEQLIQAKEAGGLDLTLSEEEKAFWSQGIPAQKGNKDYMKGELWEQLAYGVKMLQSGRLRTLALEFSHFDFHGRRKEKLVRTIAQQTAKPLARLIHKLKETGLFHQTLVAVYTIDGSRSPDCLSNGDSGTNTLMLIGGMVRGGYYGDIRVEGTHPEGYGHTYTFHRPDRNGQPVAQGTSATSNEGRISGAAAWRAVAELAGIPASAFARYPAIAEAERLPFLHRLEA